MYCRLTQVEELAADRACILECGPDKTCHADTCCARRKMTTSVSAPSQLDVGGIRRSSKHVPSKLDTDSAPNDRQFTDVIGTFIRNITQKRQTEDGELRPNHVVESSA